MEDRPSGGLFCACRAGGNTVCKAFGALVLLDIMIEK